MKYIILIILLLSGYTTLYSQRVILSGKAINAKAGAELKIADDTPYLIDGITHWPDSLLEREVVVSGYLHETDWSNAPVSNIPPGTYMGVHRLIRNAQWRLDNAPADEQATLKGTAEFRDGNPVLITSDRTYHLKEIKNYVEWNKAAGNQVGVTGNIYLLRNGATAKVENVVKILDSDKFILKVKEWKRVGLPNPSKGGAISSPKL
ncbi:hypothetical protein [Prevotella sp. 10(H)]|uniref:hypothetical protein n=1 Tax=Prevotella sp. 10(H) TaxID=1158294 RepID=UPI000AE008B2|nr:hypothetical protein [Prevotella sp. 10(H)]